MQELKSMSVAHVRCINYFMFRYCFAYYERFILTLNENMVVER